MALFIFIYLLRISTGRALRLLPRDARFVIVELRYAFED
jgi:hypothetical protein